MDRNTQQETVTFKNSSVSSLVAGKQRRSSAHSTVIIAVSWLILAVTLALDVYFTSVISENNTKLTEENQNLLKQNQHLGKENNNFNQQIEKMKKEWNKFNVSRAQWSIEAYCPKENGERQCESCQRGWRNRWASCYAIINPQNTNDWRNWTEARDDCRRMISDLVVVGDEREKEYVSRISAGTKGYWIGLRVEDGRWKWIDGSDLRNNSWIQPPEEGHCAVSYINRGWKSVSCSQTNRWICEKEALSV